MTWDSSRTVVVVKLLRTSALGVPRGDAHQPWFLSFESSGAPASAVCVLLLTGPSVPCSSSRTFCLLFVGPHSGGSRAARVGICPLTRGEGSGQLSLLLSCSCPSLSLIEAHWSPVHSRDLSRFSPRFERIFFWEAHNPIFS